MKKITALLLTFIMVFAVALTGCGKSKETSGNVAGQGKDKKLKIGFLYVGPVGDGGYTYSHDQGRKYLQSQLTNVETIIKESVKEDQAEVEKVCEDMINQGATIIFGTSFGFMDGMEKSAKKHPNIKYLHCSGYKMAENMSNYFGRDYQARYLSGIVAGMKSKANKIGYVGAFEIPEVVRGINAFALGIQSVNPSAVVKVKWTHTWYDPAKEKEAAKALLDEGVDVIAQHQDTAGPQQAAEEKGVWSIGFNTDMSKSAPKAYMTGPIWNWGPYYVEQVKKIMDGSWKAESYWGSMTAEKNQGVIDLAELTSVAPVGAKEAIDKERANIVSGKNKVFTGPIKDQSGAIKVPAGVTMADKDMLSFDWFVQGVEGKIK